MGTRSGDSKGQGAPRVPVSDPQPVRVLLVCMGNICRSPTAEGVLRALAQREYPGLAIEVDSAGTHGYHIGAAPDQRARDAARRRGFDLDGLRARELVPEDFRRFNYVLVMDGTNLTDAARIAPRDSRATFRRLLDFAPETDVSDVPDPYYGGEADFERVLDLAEAGARGLLNALRKRS